MSMTSLAFVRRRLDAKDESGFTLIELLVVMVLFAGLTGTLLTAVLATSNASRSNQTYNDLNEEARLVLNRMSRELREARQITAVVNPQGPGFDAQANSSITFEVDFDGSGQIEDDAVDPETITYIYDYAAKQLQLSAGGVTVPVLAANVEAFSLTYRSRLVDRRLPLDGMSGCNTNTGTRNGVLDWWELDRASTTGFGNCNGALDMELKYIDSVRIDLTVLKEPRAQRYRTQVDLRNVTE
jgi:prepilin-type N-terminal cleavage/methylation domain-containing protein